ncbi:MAG: hypothetical protein AAF736_21015 [Pseudomonadota bacterium]
MAARTGIDTPIFIGGRTSGSALPDHHYRIAGLDLAIDQPLPHFKPFPLPTVESGSARLSVRTHDGADETQRSPAAWQRSSRGLIGRRERDVTISGASAALTLAIEDLGNFRIELPDQLWYPAALSAEALTEALCGPLLPLVLSHHDTYCLHAAAFRHRSGLTLLLGSSGAGKTTLSRALAEAGAGLWADDTVAVRCGGASAICPGHYPQPKWPRWRATLTEPECVITHLVFLQPYKTGDVAPGDGSEQVTVTPLTPAEATLGAVEHTLTGRLFSPEGLRRHLQFAAALSKRTTACRLSYPQEPAALPSMVDCLKAVTPWR